MSGNTVGEQVKHDQGRQANRGPIRLFRTVGGPELDDPSSMTRARREVAAGPTSHDSEAAKTQSGNSTVHGGEYWLRLGLGYAIDQRDCQPTGVAAGADSKPRGPWARDCPAAMVGLVGRLLGASGVIGVGIRPVAGTGS
jgi:hypothetical protein